MRLTNRRVILVKLESTYGVDSSPLATANAILCRTSSVISPDGEEVTRDNVQPSWSPNQHIVSGLFATIPLEVDLVGSGTPGEAPPCDALLRACGMARTLAPGVSVAYAPATLGVAQQASATLYFYEDGVLHKMPGSMGNMSLNAPVGGVATLSFSMSGMWEDPEDADVPDAVLPYVDPPIVEGVGLTVGQWSPDVTALSLDLGNTVSKRKSVNAANGVAGFYLSNRNPTGSIDPEAVDLATANPWIDWKNGAVAQLHATIGAVAGNQVSIFGVGCQYNKPSYGDRDGLRTYSLPFTFTGEDDNEFSLTFT